MFGREKRLSLINNIYLIPVTQNGGVGGGAGLSCIMDGCKNEEEQSGERKQISSGWLGIETCVVGVSAPRPREPPPPPSPAEDLTNGAGPRGWGGGHLRIDSRRHANQTQRWGIGKRDGAKPKGHGGSGEHLGRIWTDGFQIGPSGWGCGYVPSGRG